MNHICIVTGANSGVGLATTQGLIARGHTVIMACRNVEKATKVQQHLAKKYPKARILVEELDLAKRQSIENFCDKIKQKHKKIDILINNAGIYSHAAKINADKLEQQFCINYLSHFLLTQKLLELIPNQASSRIISLSSVAHRNTEIFFNDINCQQQQHTHKAYKQSKLACLLFADELHRRLTLANKNIASLCVHPGISITNIFADLSVFQSLMLRVIAPFIMHNNTASAQPTLNAALSDNIKGGEFIGPTGWREYKGPPGPAVRSGYASTAEHGEKLWELSEKLTNTKFKIA